MSSTDRPLQRAARGNLFVPPSTLKLQAMRSAQPWMGFLKLTVMPEPAYDALSNIAPETVGALLIFCWP